MRPTIIVLVILLATQGVMAYNLSIGLVSSFDLNETSGNFRDIGPNNLNMTAGAGLSRGNQGINGKAIRINNNGTAWARVESMRYPSTNKENYSFSIWFNTTEVEGGDRWMIGENNSRRIVRVNDATYCGGGAGKLYISIWNGTGVECVGASANNTYNDGRFHLIVVIFNYTGSGVSGGMTQLWVDGHLDATGTGLPWDLGQMQHLNNNGTGTYSAKNVTLDDYNWWNRSLVAGEVEQLWNMTYMAITSPLSGASVTPGSVLSINFSANFGVQPVTMGMVAVNATVGGYACTLATTTATNCSGTAVLCANYTTQDYCQSGGCTWGTTSQSTGWALATSQSALNGGGWNNPTNAYTDNNALATSSASVLNATNYSGFSSGVPAGATITLIEVRVSNKAAGPSGTNQLSIRVWNGTVWSGQNLTGDISTTLGNRTMFGTGTTNWALTWTPTTVNAIQVNVSNAESGQVMSLDAVAVNITYTLPSCTGTPGVCTSFSSNATQCLRSNCTNGTYQVPDTDYLGSAIWQQNCTTSASCTGTGDVTLWTNNTVATQLNYDTESGAVNCGGTPPANSCTCTGTVDCFVECSDRCNMSTTNMHDYNIIFNGSGWVRFNGFVSNYTEATIQAKPSAPCDLYQNSTGGLA
jgi:hypothetical protein